jgi:acetaldehyde dehydrogenase
MAGSEGNIDVIKENVEDTVLSMKRENPGFEMIGSVNQVGEGIFSVTLLVNGAGYFLPSYAGNLDIINSAAVLTAKMHSNMHRNV